MGININRRIPIEQEKRCRKCNITYPSSFNFCTTCGQKLKSTQGRVYANMGKNGVSSISVKSGKVTVNSKGRITLKIAPGISYTSAIKKKK